MVVDLTNGDTPPQRHKDHRGDTKRFKLFVKSGVLRNAQFSKKTCVIGEICGLELEESRAKSGRFDTVAEGLYAVDGDNRDVVPVSLE